MNRNTWRPTKPRYILPLLNLEYHYLKNSERSWILACRRQHQSRGMLDKQPGEALALQAKRNQKDAIMNFRRLVSLALLYLSAQLTGVIAAPAFAQADKADPTFNGLANVLHCGLRTVIVCDGDYCSDASGTGGGNLWISLQSLQISTAFPMGTAPTSRIELTDVSQSSFNSILSVKFTFTDPRAGRRTGLLLFIPRNGGGYEIHYGGTGGPADSHNKFGSLTISRSTVGGTCEIDNE
jgi:hypothetical protein